MNTANQYQQIIDSCSRQVAELEERIERKRNIITGTPWIIECSPGLYLVADGEQFRGGRVTGRVVCYTPDSIDAAVQHVRDASDGVFPNARKISHREALELELASMRDIIDRVQAVCA
jgi:hypothetical protein